MSSNTSQGNLSQEIADVFANLEVQESLSFVRHPGSSQKQTSILNEQGLLNGIPDQMADRFGADLDHELGRDEMLVKDVTSQNAVQSAPPSEGAAPLQFTDKFEGKGGTPEGHHTNHLNSTPRHHPSQSHQHQPTLGAEKMLGRGSSTQSGFNAIGSQPRKHNQWHGGGRVHNIAGGGRGLNSQLKVGGAGGGLGNKVYQNRTTVNNSGVGGTKKGPGNNPNSASVQQRNAVGNVRRKSKNIVVPALEDASSSSLQAEPSGWGDLPSPKPVNVDTGTSAWGAPPNDLGQFPKDMPGAGWGEKGTWRGQQGGRDEGDSTGTQAAGWHGSRTGWGNGKMAADAQVAKLLEMGFNREDVVKALDANNLNFDSALGDLLASNVEDSPMPPEPSTLTAMTSDSTFSANAANSLVTHHLTANINGRKQPQTTATFFPNKTQPPVPVLQGMPSTNNGPTQVAWPTAPTGQPGIIALRNPVGLPQTQLPPPNTAKLRSQLLQQQQLNQQMALLQLQLSRMPAPVANIRLQIAHFQLMSQQFLQQQQQLKGMAPTQQTVAQQQQVAQQLFQVNQIIQHLQQQLMLALKQNPNALKGPALPPSINPTLAQQAAIQGLLAAGGQQVGGVNIATPLKLGAGPVVSAGRTVPFQPGLLPTQLSLPQNDIRASIGTVVESTAAGAVSKIQPNRSLSAPSAPTVPEGNSKRMLPKIDARFFPDSIPEFQPGKLWQPRPKPTEPAQVYGNGTSTAPVMDTSNKISASTASNASVAQPKKLSAEARPFTLQKWGTTAVTEEAEVPKVSESSSSSTSSEASPSSQAPPTGKRPQQLSFADDDILDPSVPSYGLSTTPLTSMWSMSSQQRMSSQFADASKGQRAQASDPTSPLPTTLPSKEEGINPLLSPPPLDKSHLKDMPNIGLWNHEGLARAKIHSPEPSFAEWQAGKKAHLTVFKLPTNPPSAWLHVQGLPVGVEQEEVKATCSEYGELRSFFLSEAESSALIQYQTKEQAMHAKTGLDKTLLNGLSVSTDFASDVDIERFFDRCNSCSSPNSVPTFGPLEGVDATGVVSPSSLLHPEDSVTSRAPGPKPVSPISQVANGNNPPTERPVGLASEEVQSSKWEGPPIDIPKSQVSQLWSMGDYNSLMGYNTATPTTPDAEEWTHISSSPSLTKFLPGGLF